MKCRMQCAQNAGKQADEKQKVVALVAVGQLKKMRRQLDWPSLVALPGAGMLIGGAAKKTLLARGRSRQPQLQCGSPLMAKPKWSF